MKEISFRAFHKEQKVWATVGLIWNDGKFYQSFSDYNAGAEMLPDYWAVTQFTGIRDKHHVRIFEGDIVKNKYGVNWVVDWHEAKNGWGIRYCDKVIFLSALTDSQMNMQHYEVVGDVFSNPELLLPQL